MDMSVPAGSLSHPRWWIGTSGYSYAEWVEAGFYPEGTPAGKMLSLYAQRFSAVELNFTWYQMPRPEALERMQEQVPASFRFAAKLHRSLTHEVDADTWRQQAAQYRIGIAPLIQARQLLAVLIQLPGSFHRTADNRRYLAALLDELAGLPLAVEFRHVSWAEERVYAELARRKTTLAVVDTPPLPYLFPAVDVITNPDLVYVRFHGRNLAGWRSGSMQRQFDYAYTDAELQQWIDRHWGRLTEETGDAVLFFNNHVRGQAARNALMLTQLLQGFRCAPSST